MIEATVVHIEDEKMWRDQIKKDIERRGKLAFREFIGVPSIEEVRDRLRSMSGPVVIIMDLKLVTPGEEKKETRLKGYEFLLHELDEFMRRNERTFQGLDEFVSRNARTAVFVISALLTEERIDKLTQKGIPENHIFNKGEWARTRDEFHKKLQEAISDFEGVARKNIVNEVSGRKIDPYLIHSFRTRGEEIERKVSDRNKLDEKTREPILMAMLVQATDDAWNHEGIPDLKVIAQTGNIYSCLGSLDTITALENDPEVIRIEASRPGAGPEHHEPLPLVVKKRNGYIMQRSKLVAMIKTYQDLPRNGNSFDRDPPSELAIGNAITALHNIFEALPDRIDPSNDESIIFTYYRDDWYYLIEFYNDGEIVFLKRKGSEHSHVEDVTLADLDRVLKEINDGYGK